MSVACFRQFGVKTQILAALSLGNIDNLSVMQPEVLYDLPSGGRRLVQRTEGYDATIVSGVPVQLHGEATGALPGRLIRGAPAAP